MKNILVGLDGSATAPHVLAEAIALARVQNAKLTLVRVVSVPSEVPFEFQPNLINFEKALIDHANADIAQHAASVPNDMLASCSVEVATPWDGICRKAKELDAAYIVIGSHRYGGLDRLLGTTAAKVVNHAHCSVLVVRRPQA